MADYQTLLKNLEAKRTKFLEFEEISNAMLGCPVDELEGHVTRRAEIIGEIDTIDAKMADAILEDEGAVALFKAVSGEANRGELTGELGEIYDAAAAVRSVISRLPDLEEQVSMRLRMEQQHILDLIKNANQSTEAKVAKFWSNEQGRQGNVIRDA